MHLDSVFDIIVAITTAMMSIIAISLISIIIAYNHQKPDVRKSTFDIATCNLAFSTIIFVMSIAISLILSLHQFCDRLSVSFLNFFDLLVYATLEYQANAVSVTNLIAIGYLKYFTFITGFSDYQMRMICVSSSIGLATFNGCLDLLGPVHGPTLVQALMGKKSNQKFVSHGLGTFLQIVMVCSTSAIVFKLKMKLAIDKPRQKAIVMQLGMLAGVFILAGITSFLFVLFVDLIKLPIQIICLMVIFCFAGIPYTMITTSQFITEYVGSNKFLRYMFCHKQTSDSEENANQPPDSMIDLNSFFQMTHSMSV